MPGHNMMRRRAELLIRYLSFQGVDGEQGISVRNLSRQDWSDLVAAALSVQLFPALVHVMRRRDPATLNADEITRLRAPPLANFHYRSASQRQHLLAAVRAINTRGLEPCLACGARELWLTAPSWRYVEEIELLVPPGSFDKASAAIEGSGWQPVRALLASGYRTERWWVHRGTSGYIALRGIGTNPAIQRVLAQSECESSSMVASADGAVARLLSPSVDCLHAVASHHFAEVSLRGTVAAIKPLYEFAARLTDMQPAERSELRDAMAADCEFRAILSNWNATACRAFDLPPATSLAPSVCLRQPVRLVDVAGLFHVALEPGAGFST